MAQIDLDAAFETYASRGFCIIDNLLDDASLNEARQVAHTLKESATVRPEAALAAWSAEVGRKPRDFSFEATFDQAGREDGTVLRKISGIQHYDAYFNDFEARHGLRAVAARLLEASDPVFINALIFWKSHRARSRQPWHQDLHAAGPDFKARHDRGVNIWIALEDCTVENGCMWFLDGKPTTDYLEHRPSSDWRDGARLEVPLSEAARAAATPALISAGSALAFGMLTPHATFENQSQRARPSLSYVYSRRRADAH